jgi:CubicO group peptidase (beta-lactamase class C family)
MKELNPTMSMNMSPLASESTFGHLGFTGTAAYADPENNLVYIFCSNRTFPSRLNQTFNNRDYRTKVQTIIYKALRGYTADVYL